MTPFRIIARARQSDHRDIRPMTAEQERFWQLRREKQERELHNVTR
jgi:hypothetical protein